MEVRGRNGKWLRAGNWRAVGVSRINIVFELSAGIRQGGG